MTRERLEFLKAKPHGELFEELVAEVEQCWQIIGRLGAHIDKAPLATMTDREILQQYELALAQFGPFEVGPEEFLRMCHEDDEAK